MKVHALDIEKILVRLDIEGLIELGAPLDEYIAEAENIALAANALAMSDISDLSVAYIVQQVWNKFFGPFSDSDLEKRKAEFMSVAKQITKLF